MIIYKIKSPSGKCYVGQTIRPFKARRAQHCATRAHTPIANAIRKYGDKMEWSIIDKADSIAELNRKEIHYIAKFNSQVPNGYNCEAGGNNATKSKHTRRLLSESMKGKPKSKAHCAAVSAGKTGKKFTLAARIIRSNAQRKLWQCPEFRAKMKLARQGNKNASGKRTAESCANMSAAAYRRLAK